MRAPYSKEWLHNDQILCYRFHELSRAMIDDWFNDAASVNHLWPLHKPLHTLIDLRLESLVVSAQVLLRTALPLGVRPRRVFADEPRAIDWLLEQPRH